MLDLIIILEYFYLRESALSAGIND